MHIERMTIEQLATMTLDQLADLDLAYKAELERLQSDRGVMRTILHARAAEAGISQQDAVRIRQRETAKV